jgi:hypothetical protein
MKRKNALALFAGLLSAIVALSAPPAARANDRCSTAKAAGDWGLTLTGTLLLPTGPVPAAAVARGTFDAEGNIVSATESRNVGGGFANETLTGSWTVNSDCTGTASVKAFENGQLVRTSVLAIVFVDNMREVRMVQDSLVFPDGTNVPAVITVSAKRVSAKEE